MNYLSAILDYLVDTFERRGLYNDTGNQKRQGVFLYVDKVFPEYADNYDGSAYQDINEAIEYLRQQGVLQGKKDARGNYGRLQLYLLKIELCHHSIGRPVLGETRRAMLELLQDWDVRDCDILEQFRTSQMERLYKNKAVEYGITDDCEAEQESRQALSLIYAR